MVLKFPIGTQKAILLFFDSLIIDTEAMERIINQDNPKEESMNPVIDSQIDVRTGGEES